MKKTKTSFRILPFNHRDCVIQLLFNYGYKSIDSITGKTKYHPLSYGTGITIKKSDWDKENSQVLKSHPEAKTLNLSLLSLETEVEKVYDQFLYKGVIPSPAQLRSELDERLGKSKSKKPVERTTLYDFIEDYIKRVEADGSKSGKTIEAYSEFLNVLREYQNTKGKVVNLSEITEAVYFDFVGFYSKKGYFVAGKFIAYSQNQIWTMVKVLKKFIREAQTKGIVVPIDLNQDKYKFEPDVPDTIALSFEELDKLSALNLSKSKGKVEITRDLFIMSAYTGLRFSDTSQLNELRIESKVINGKKKDVLKVLTIKTREEVQLPVLGIIKDIWNRYNGSFPAAPSNGVFNRNIKHIAKLAGMTESVTLSAIRGGEVVNERYKKYELISSHTGRRTMCTNFYKLGIPVKTIMALSGHTDEQSYYRYVKVSKEEHVGLFYDMIEAKMPQLL